MADQKSAHRASRESRTGAKEPPRFVASATCPALLDDDQLFVAARWFQKRRDELRREFTRRGCGKELAVYLDTPPLEKLDAKELEELENTLHELQLHIERRKEVIATKQT